MNYIVYLTTNTINEMKYIGVHKQMGVDFDGYLGSGTRLLRAIRKHGKSNFHRETLFVFSNLSDALSKEAEIVTKELVESSLYYNMTIGGGQAPMSLPVNTDEERYLKARALIKAPRTQEWKDRISTSTKVARLNNTNRKIRDRTPKILTYDPNDGRKGYRSDAKKIRIREALKSVDMTKNRRTSVTTPLGVFSSCGDAAKAHNRSPAWISHMKKTNPIEFY